MPNPSKRPNHLFMIQEFHLADFCTLCNAACGVLAIFFAIRYVASQDLTYFYLAAAMAPAAFVFDFFDGRIARWRGQNSPLGRELDSLADIISFGIAPAVLGFAAGLQNLGDFISLVYFVCCGVSRLARFNVTSQFFSNSKNKITHYEGTPIPTSILLTGALAYTASGDQLSGQLLGDTWKLGLFEIHPFALLFVLSGTLMITKALRIRKP